jgi:sporulation protein YhbH
MKRYTDDSIRIAAEVGWYDLFSRGARDWLRHNEKIREAVENALPNLIAGPDILTGSSSNTVGVPVRLLEHARFRLGDPDSESGAGQGAGEVGQVLKPGTTPGSDPQSGSKGGSGQGELKFVLELKIDDLMDWLWEEMRLPELKPRRSPASEDADLVREGWDRRGARSRLDRRRTVKEAVKRRAIQESPAPFTDDDLRFRQIVARQKPAINAAVIFALDVSGSMGDTERQLAKTFFFFALQGVRRQYAKVEMAFLAHAAEAWEFNESEFFQTSGTGGTVSSTVLDLSLGLVRTRFDPSRYNVYLFYASDGDNYSDDRAKTAAALRDLTDQINYTGYVEIRPSYGISAETEMASVFAELQREQRSMGMARITGRDDVWNALRAFFQQQAEAAA